MRRHFARDPPGDPLGTALDGAGRHGHRERRGARNGEATYPMPSNGPPTVIVAADDAGQQKVHPITDRAVGTRHSPCHRVFLQRRTRGTLWTVMGGWCSVPSSQHFGDPRRSPGALEELKACHRHNSRAGFSASASRGAFSISQSPKLCWKAGIGCSRLCPPPPYFASSRWTSLSPFSARDPERCLSRAAEVSWHDKENDFPADDHGLPGHAQAVLMCRHRLSEQGEPSGPPCVTPPKKGTLLVPLSAGVHRDDRNNASVRP